MAKPKSCEGCPLYEIGKGFVLGCGDPKRAKIMFILEAPGSDEVQYVVNDVLELKRRREAYPSLAVQGYYQRENSLTSVGMPLVGKSGALFDQWLLKAAGIRREDIFIDNTLRCLPPKSGKSGDHYPKGEDRKKAEIWCRQYDRIKEFDPDIAVITMHPAAILRETTPLYLIVEDLKKARDFAAQGHKVVVLMGGKAVKQFLKFGETVTRFRGNYKWLK